MRGVRAAVLVCVLSSNESGCATAIGSGGCCLYNPTVTHCAENNSVTSAFGARKSWNSWKASQKRHLLFLPVPGGERGQKRRRLPAPADTPPLLGASALNTTLSPTCLALMLRIGSHQSIVVSRNTDGASLCAAADQWRSPLRSLYCCVLMGDRVLRVLRNQRCSLPRN